jgi:putative redox protein
MVAIDIVYEGELHCRAVHGPSSTTLVTDAPVDNNGRGESFSPTDLVATALGTCMATVMGIFAKQRGWAMEGTRVAVKKHMTTTSPRRIARLDVVITMGDVTSVLGDEARSELEQAAHTCPVCHSLLPAIEVPVAFVWPARG